MLFGWIAADHSSDTRCVLRQMAAVLRAHPGQQLDFWIEPGIGIGLFHAPCLDGEIRHAADPVVDPGERFVLWMAGEAFSWAGDPLGGAAESQSPAFRARLLQRLISEGASAISGLDGEYQIALWDRAERTCSVLVDRFAALPVYWTHNRRGFAFAGGVRGVLMAPGVELRPDTEALRQAVTFGGYRLGDRTNVAGVRMAPPASVIVQASGEGQVRRYWSWADAPVPYERSNAAQMRATQDAWRLAVRRRLEGSGRPGLTLSGGLDSRAILAEASLQAGRVTTVTYGVPQADDVRFARRAARAAGAEWLLVPLYGEGWLERRLAHVLATDGMVNLVDLMHMEALPHVVDRMDLLLSGYAGETVSGGTYLDVHTVQDVLAGMPYYGGRLGLPNQEVLALAAEALAGVGGRGRFVVFEHKFPQAISRITAAARPWIRVRRPFVDYGFWDQAYTVPDDLRRSHRWHEAWLTTTYPRLFRRIPNQRTGVPPAASRARYHATRVARYGWRRLLGAAAGAGLPVTPRERTYHPDWRAWRVPEVREQIASTIMRSGSIAVDVFGRSRLSATLADYFDADAAPTQVIGALFAYEYFHRELPAVLAAARQREPQREDGRPVRPLARTQRDSQ